MDKKELQLLGKQRDNLISSLYASYEATLSKAQGVLFKQFAVEIMDKLEYDEDGKVINNAKNRNVLVSLDKFFKKWNDDTNPRVLNVLLDGVQQIMNFNYGYYSKFNEVPKASLIKLREKALSNVRGWLGMEDNEIKPNGYLDTLVQNDTIKNQIKDAVMKTIYAQDGWNAAKKTLQTIIEGDGSGSLGSLEKYHRNFSYDLYSQIDRATGKTYADDLKFDCAIYEGGIIETSRPFCKEHNGNVYHISEIKKMKPEKAIPPNYNPIFDMGGYACRHHWNWIPPSLAVMLRPDIKKFLDGTASEETPPTEKPKEQPKPQPLKETKKEPLKTIEVETVEKPKINIIDSKIDNIKKPKEAKEILKQIFPTIEDVKISTKLGINELKERLKALNVLNDTYNIEATEIQKISFSSTKTYHGAVTSYASGRIKDANFGHTTDSLSNRTYDFDQPRNNLLKGKSRVDTENIEVATLYHEFAHFISTMGRKGINQTKVNEFWNELKFINREYFNELAEYRQKAFEYKNDSEKADLALEYRDKIGEIYLGKYAGSNLDEFFAEGFTEYKLSSKPSKYALKIGKLTDEKFKK